MRDDPLLFRSMKPQIDDDLSRDDSDKDPRYFDANGPTLQV